MELLKYCRNNDIRNIFVILLDTNNVSEAVLEKFGFSRRGHLPKVADFDGKEVGPYYYEKRVIPRLQ